MDWTESEIGAAVEAYVWMLGEERAGRSYNKSEVRRQLLAGALNQRSEGAAERRMQNITAVLRRSFGVAGIDGYKPLSQTGVGQGAVIRAALSSCLPWLDRPPTQIELEERVTVSRNFMRSAGVEMPVGNARPAVYPSATTRYVRDVEVAAWVLEQAKGRCEACGCRAPFNRASGDPYLEVHHVTHLAVGGPDVIENTVAVCPNCHREAHLGNDPAGWIDRILKKVVRLRVS